MQNTKRAQNKNKRYYITKITHVTTESSQNNYVLEKCMILFCIHYTVYMSIYTILDEPLDIRALLLLHWQCLGFFKLVIVEIYINFSNMQF